MMSQLAGTQAPPRPTEAWVSFLRAHAAITRELSVRLQRDQGLTLSDFDVLLALSHSEDGMMRRVDLAGSVLLTASGITRLLDGLDGDLVLPVAERRMEVLERDHLHEAADRVLADRLEPLAGRLALEPVQDARLGRDQEALGRRLPREADHLLRREDLRPLVPERH